MPKKMKVRLTKKIHAYRHGDHRYFPGDIVEIEESAFRADFMEKIEEPKKPEKKKESAAPVPPIEEREFSVKSEKAKT